MAYARTANSSALFVFLAAAAFLISGIVTASPKPSAQQGHLIPPLPSQLFSVQVLSALPEGVDFVRSWPAADLGDSSGLEKREVQLPWPPANVSAKTAK